MFMFPLVAAIILLSGSLSFMNSRTTLTKIANRHLAYKAEQLRDFINSEWGIIEKLGLDSSDEYRKAEEESFKTFAYSLLRAETEQILVTDSKGTQLFRMGSSGLTADMLPAASDKSGAAPAIPQTGWFQAELFGEARVGVSFYFPPFDWVVSFTDQEDAFFGEIQALWYSHVWILLAAIVATTLFASLYIRSTAKPLAQLAGRIQKTLSAEAARNAPAEDSLELAVDRLLSLLEETRERERTAQANLVKLAEHIDTFADERCGGNRPSRIYPLAIAFCESLRLQWVNPQEVALAATLRDVGKLHVLLTVLLKKEPLNADERDNARSHVGLGLEILKDSPFLGNPRILEAIRFHHERWDGSGYPSSLSRADIPLSARIVCLLDVYIALTSNRPYREALTPHAALKEMINMQGSVLDPELIEAFQRYFNALPV